MTDQECWRPIAGFPSYEVSDLGRIRSKARWGRWHFLRGGIKREPNGREACVQISLREGGATTVRKLHHLVLEAFVGPCPLGLEGCHSDGRIRNNRLDNLRWDTHAANIADCVRHGTKTLPPVQRRGSNARTWLNGDEVRCIRAEPDRWGVQSMLGRAFGVSHKTIARIRAEAA